MKIKSMKLANAVRVGSTTHSFVEQKMHDIELVAANQFIPPGTVKITSKRTGDFNYTTLFNAVEFCLLEDLDVDSTPTDPSAPRRGRPPKA